MLIVCSLLLQVGLCVELLIDVLPCLLLQVTKSSVWLARLAAQITWVADK